MHSVFMWWQVNWESCGVGFGREHGVSLCLVLFGHISVDFIWLDKKFFEKNGDTTYLIRLKELDLTMFPMYFAYVQYIVSVKVKPCHRFVLNNTITEQKHDSLCTSVLPVLHMLTHNMTWLITSHEESMKPTWSHEARGRDGHHRDVLGTVLGVEVYPASAMPPSIFRTGDGKHSGLVVGGRREGTSFLRLLFHLVQKHRVLNLSTQTWWGCWWYTLWHNMFWRVGMNRQRFDHMTNLFGHII